MERFELTRVDTDYSNISFSDLDSEDDEGVCPLCCNDLGVEDLNFSHASAATNSVCFATAA